MAFNIAIDGPAGAGKSTIAKIVAKKLDILYVDTGAMYRAMGLYFKRLGMDGTEEKEILAACRDISIELQYVDGQQQVLLNGENVTAFLRTQEIGDMASKTSPYRAVREKLVSEQRKIAQKMDLIMDGRDIGTCVLPEAALKIYLTADPAVRARRRYDELAAKGETCDLEKIRQEIVERDYRDMHREISPLRQAEDAVEVDTSDMSIEEAADTVIRLCRERRQ